ncbi:sideroflexin-1-like [Mizuhopecten yessoensis]|uniref:Sidoreflexin n=1 Tax=Mizuhopecten yessoensis TaxID=6573 RepID=A0A210R275_MIZYE|nr:sideroflexin-1-like [Mizuhopecten yessoensis]XP_021375381.1 sideroflexin-1-like [Mizuhopecten yessoensis]OWF55044.1 Sideroflexin-1 [Mizuhopecten yessoensis]
MSIEQPRVNISEPRYDQNTYGGRARHFFITTNPLNLLATNQQLEHAKSIVVRYRNGERINGLTENDLWRAKHLYDSAFHPVTNEKMVLFGRMSSQVPMNMSITGCMLAFHKTTPAIIFWQWMNQSYNSVVNYSNKAGSNVSDRQLAMSYVLGTSGAVGTALWIKSLVKNLGPMVARFVPFAAVAAANCINIPCMRSRELMEGIALMDQDRNDLDLTSKTAARKAIGMVVVSRILIATPVMVIPPLVMNQLDKKALMKRAPWLNAPIQVMLVGFILAFATPLCCALFPQKSSMDVSSLEAEVRKKLEALPNPPKTVYFNKGL